jgi:hypothetical protein
LKYLLSVLLLLCALGLSSTKADQIIYDDALQNGWANWSYSTTCDFNNGSPLHGGTKSLAVTITDAWGALSLWHGNFDSTPYSDITFWIHGGTSGGQQLQIYGELNGVSQPAVSLPLPTAGTWQQVTVSLASMGVANKPNFSRFSIQDRTGAAKPTFYLDDMKLVTAVTPPAITLTSPADGAFYTPPATVSLAATVTANGHTINKVGFYNDSTLLAEDTTSPYTATWSGVGVGNYSVIARVTYDGGTALDSAPANIIVATNSPVTVTVDAQLNRHAINPLIYGVAFATTTQLSDLNAPLNRSGGNAETRYNWQLDCHNHANDWYYISLADGSGTPGEAADNFVTSSRSSGAEPMLTIPMIGSAPKLGSGRTKLASYSVKKYGPQTGTEPGWPDNGNGISTTNVIPVITWNDINDANFVTNSAFAQAWLTHLTNRWGVSTNGGVRYYFMDNEHSIWHQTHRDVHHDGASRAEIRDKFFDYAGKVKAADPNAIVLGPEEFGWSGYFNSGADLQYYDTYGYGSTPPDRGTNGNMDYVCWLLNEFHKRDTNTHQRLLDYFTLHRYTEDSNVGGGDVSTDTQLKRNRWTRSFWDTNYVDESWIQWQTDNKVMLIPRMKNWVATYYPGTKIGITEYNWGAESHINGATTQGDILGIFGREGLDLATRWTTPDSSTPTYKAMKIWRNYDGNKSTFGDTSVNAAGPNPDYVSAYAAIRSSDGAMTIMMINKQLWAIVLPTINLANFYPAGTAQVWQLTSGNSITRLSDLTLMGTTITNILQPQSITLYVVPAAVLAGPASNPSPASGAVNVAVNSSLSWTGGTNATSHRLYMGVSSNAVATATTNSPEFKGSLAVTNYTPATLAYGTSYYWRVDEMAGAYATTGAVWTFTAPLLAAPASNPNPSNGAANVPVSTSISWTPGTNATSHRVYLGTSSSAVANATTNSPEFKGNPPGPSYTPATLAYTTTYYWRVDEMAGAYATTGAVWSFTTPVLAGVASGPNPANGASGVPVSASLTWTAGANTTSHQLYFGANSNAVANATSNAPEFKGTLAGASFAPGVLAASGRFYWRVDEVAGAYVTAGPVWTFATVVSGTNSFPLGGGLGTGDTFVVSFPSQVGQTYRVERSESLSPASWSPVADNVPGTDAPIQISDSDVSLQAQRFYLVIILPP